MKNHIHDSFIVREEEVDCLQSVMLTAYERKMGRSICIKSEPTLLDDLLAGETNVTVTNRYSLGMNRFEEKKQEPEYSEYRKREEWTVGAVTDRAKALRGSERRNRSALPARTKKVGPTEALRICGSTGHPGRRNRVWDHSPRAR